LLDRIRAIHGALRRGIVLARKHGHQGRAQDVASCAPAALAALEVCRALATHGHAWDTMGSEPVTAVGFVTTLDASVTAHLGLMPVVVGTVVVMPVLPVAVVVDVVVDAVAVVTILGNVSWSTVTSGACASPLPIAGEAHCPARARAWRFGSTIINDAIVAAIVFS
jgi:hypothetical protein